MKNYIVHAYGDLDISATYVTDVDMHEYSECGITYMWMYPEINRYFAAREHGVCYLNKQLDVFIFATATQIWVWLQAENYIDAITKFAMVTRGPEDNFCYIPRTPFKSYKLKTDHI